jgi:hypothetical protein
MAIIIVNKRDFHPERYQHFDAVVEYVSRPSILGNPFNMRNESERDEVCDKYEEWLRRSFVSDLNVRTEILGIANDATKCDVYLVCWCAPKRCHAESIKRLIEEINGVRKE